MLAVVTTLAAHILSNLIHQKENEHVYVSECFAFLCDFSSRVEFDDHFLKELFFICSTYYQAGSSSQSPYLTFPFWFQYKPANREIIKSIVKCLANCVSFGSDAKVSFISLIRLNQFRQSVLPFLNPSTVALPSFVIK